MKRIILHNLNRVLGIQLAAVQQHFIHVLMLRTWNEHAVADQITSIDAVDLPNAMRVVEYVVASGHLPALASDHQMLAGHMPKPGNNLKSVYVAEMHLDQRLKDVLISVEQALTPSASSEAIELVSIPLERRAAYQDWLRHQLKHPCDDVRPRALAGPAKLALDSLFANLMVTINQTLVHAFVHWNRGDYDLANSTWEMSGAAMMHATSIVNSFAVRHIAPDPTRAVLLGKVAKPCFAQVRSDALANDLLLANQCYAIAQQAVVNQQEADLTATCGRVKTYYDELISWRPGQQLPELDNPCVDFERVLRSYVRGSRASAASSDS